MKNKFLFLIAFLIPLLGIDSARAQCMGRHTICGTVGGFAGDGGPATSARIYQPLSMVLDSAGDLYFIDAGNYRIRKIEAISGNIYTVAGSGTLGNSGDGGPAVAARISGSGSSIAVDRLGNLYMTDVIAGKIRKLNLTSGRIAHVATVNSSSITCDRQNRLVLAGGGVIKRLDTSGVVTYLGGDSTRASSRADGPASSVTLDDIRYLNSDIWGNVYFVERSVIYTWGGSPYTKIRKLDTAGYITTISGSDVVGYAGDGGPATAARIKVTGGMQMDNAGNLIFHQDTMMRKIDLTTGTITTVGGTCSTFGNVACFAINDTGGVFVSNLLHYINLSDGMYSNIVSLSTSDTLTTPVCTTPAVYKFGVSGTINEVPSGIDSVHLRINYGDGYFDTTVAYWSSVVAGVTVYGFGSNTNWLPQHIYMMPGTYVPTVEVTTMHNYHQAADFDPIISRTACDSNIYEVAILSIKDTVNSLPCSSPMTDSITVIGICSGTPNGSDSICVRVEETHFYGNVPFVKMVPIDTVHRITIGGRTYNTFVYTVVDTNLESGNTYRHEAYAITNTAYAHSYTGIASIPYPTLREVDLFDDVCNVGNYIDVSIAPPDSVYTGCTVPFIDTFSIKGKLWFDADTVSVVAYYINYGDGTDDTLYVPSSADGYGGYFCNTLAVHTYYSSGTYTPYIQVISPAFDGGTLSGRSPSITIGTSCSNISGMLYYDNNNSCTIDTGEDGMSYWPLAVINHTVPDTSYYWADVHGAYHFTLIDGYSYSIVPDFYRGFGYTYDSLRVACPATGFFTFTPSSSSVVRQDFGFQCFGSPSTVDMAVAAWGNGMVVGDTGVVYIHSGGLWGHSCDSVNSSVTLTLDSNLTFTGMWSGPYPDSISGHTIIWNYYSHGHVFEFEGMVKVGVANTLHIGDTLQNTVYIAPTAHTDPNLTSNTYRWKNAVRASWDPNEKDVSPHGYGSEGFIKNGTSLSYMVHFQNTGTARARNVVICDTIDSDLDIATLQLIGSSDTVQIIRPGGSGNLVKFVFNNIYLPDSTSDPEGSKGYVAFSIEPHEDRPANTEIKNTAYIFFDYNPAIITNTALNTIEDTVGSITGPDTVCTAATITLSNHISGGTWAATGGHTTVAGGIVTGISVGIDTIFYTVYGEQTATKLVYVNATAASVSITGADSICSGTSTSLTSSHAGGTWSSTAAATATVSGSGSVTAIASGTVVISYTVPTSCGTISVTHPLYISGLPAAAIAGTSSLCAGASATLTGTTAGGSWAVSSATVASVTTGGVVTGHATGIDTVYYILTNVCGSDSATRTITVLSLPAAGTISGPATVCVGDTITLAASVTGGVWAITGTHASIAAGNIIGVSAGTASVYYYATNTCGTDTANYSVTVMPLPDAGAITAGSDTVCEGTTITFTETASGGVWSSSNPTVATVNSGGAVAAVSPGTVSITYTVTNSCGTATAARILVIQDSTDCTMGVIGGTEHKPALQVYPNPTDGAINVVLGANSAQVTLMLCDMSGRILAEIQRENTRKVAFRCNELAGGIYTLTVIADGQVSHHKIIVQ